MRRLCRSALWLSLTEHAAFKDVALQFLGNLFEYFLSKATKEEQDKGLTVLGATSGDTGSAAIYGLRGKAHIETFVLHPRGRVSKVQELQVLFLADEYRCLFNHPARKDDHRHRAKRPQHCRRGHL